MADGETWRDRVARGEHFEMPDPTLIVDLVKTHALVNQFNALPMTAPEERGALLRQIFGKVGTNVIVLPGLSIDVGVNVTLGNDVVINSQALFLAAFPITIGNGVLIGPRLMISSTGHPARYADRVIRDPVTGQRKDVTTGAPIVIEENVWIGAAVVVLPGVTIGARSTIGAGAVVTKSIPPDSVAVGNPGKGCPEPSLATPPRPARREGRAR
jgi:maltose O-acetyltransferase